MQLIDLTFHHYNFYCPVTGECISANGEPVNYDASSLRGYWVSEELESPSIFCQDFENAYHAYLKKCLIDNKNEDEDEDEDENEAGEAGEAGEADYVPGWEELEVFLKEYNGPNWAVFNITTRFSDQDATNAWYVIDLSQQKE